VTASLSGGEILRDDAWLVATWRGDVDMANASRLEEAALESLRNADDGLIVDLTRVSYLDSAGIRALLNLRRLLAHRQLKMFVVLPESSVLRKALEVGGVWTAVTVHPTIEQALQQR
jgi:anti-anti-sigma factor